MRFRVVTAAVVVAGLAVPAGAQGDAFLRMENNRLLDIGAEYSGYGPAQNITVRVEGEGYPALTGDTPGAQRVRMTDTEDAFVQFGAGVETPGDGRCWVDSVHRAHCNASSQTQLAYRASHCSYPPGCTGPGPNGLIRWLGIEPQGSSVRIRDVPGDTPLPWDLYLWGPYPGGGTRDVELWSAESVGYHSGADNVDVVVLHAGVGASTLELGPGDDNADSRNGAADTIACGDGNDTVQADAADSVAADCETATTS